MAAPATTAAFPRSRPVPLDPVRRLRPDPWLSLVAAGYAVVQLAVAVPHAAHALAWDESVYVSQVDPRVPAAYFSAPRSRGVSLLVAPVLAATTSVPVLRVVLALLSAVTLYAVFRVWRPLLGRGVVSLAALLFAGLWITEISGASVMPNLWVAFGAVAAVGWFLRVPAERRARWWLAAAVIGVTLVRTPDGGWLALPLLAAGAFRRVWRPALPALLGGLALGAVQWVVEAYTRFGGVPQRLRVSSDVEGGVGLHLNVGAALRSLNGPLLCRPCHVPLRHVELTLWWLALPLVVVAVVVTAARDLRRSPEPLPDQAATALLPVGCAVSLAVPYLFLIGYAAPRFLLPCYALLALPAAQLAVRALSRLLAARSPAAVGVSLGLLLALQLGSQVVVLDRVAASAQVVSERYASAARGLHGLGIVPPCLVTGWRAQPVGYDAGCASAQTSGNNRSTTARGLARRAGRERTALVAASADVPRPGFARSWVRYRLHGIRWVAYLPPRLAQGAPGQPWGAREPHGAP